VHLIVLVDAPLTCLCSQLNHVKLTGDGHIHDPLVIEKDASVKRDLYAHSIPTLLHIKVG
jgi:hypothetical protein